MNRLLIQRKHWGASLGVFVIIIACIYVFAQNSTRIREEERARQLKATLQTCLPASQGQTSDYLICMKKELSLAIDILPARFILSTIEQGFHSNDEITRVYCHDVAHHIGKELAHKNADNIKGALAQCDSTCNNGCYHGVMETYFGKLLTKISSADLDRLCRPFLYHSPAFESQCFHGLGHGLNALTRGNIPQSLNICDALFWQYDRESCYYGAIMESLSSTLHAETLHPLDLEKALDVCRQLAVTYRSSCYMVLGSAGLNKEERDAEWAFDRCDREAPDAYKNSCYTAIGFQISRLQNWDIPASLGVCAHSALHQKTGCYAGLVMDFTNNTDVSQLLPTICRNIEQGYRKMCWLGYVNSLLVRLPLYTF